MLKVANSVISASRITGVLPVANGGTGVTTSTGTGNTVLSAAPTLSGDVTLSTGNLIPSTAAKGVNFTANTPAAGMTSQLLNAYEEGTWTPTDASGAGLSLTLGTCVYTKIGRQVTAVFDITFPVTADVNTQLLGGLPFSTATGVYGGCPTYTTHSVALNLLAFSTNVSFRQAAGGSNNSNAAYSGNIVRGVITYFI